MQSPKNKKFLYLGEWNFVAPNLKNFFYFSKKDFMFNFLHWNVFITVFFIRIFFIRIIRRNFYVINNKLIRLFLLQQHIYILLKTLEDNSFYLYSKLNQSILLIDKYIKTPFLVFQSWENLCWFFRNEILIFFIV